MITLAAAQFDPHLGDVAYNLSHMQSLLIEAVRQGAQLVVFPECAITGYNFASLDDARAIAEPLDVPIHHSAGPGLPRDERAPDCRHLARRGQGCLQHCVADRTARGDRQPMTRRTCPSAAPTNSPRMAAAASNVYDTPLGKIGMLICYDLRFPEAARTLALRGADIIALPTNWPTGADTAPEFMVRARAFENRVFVVACNRVGQERGAGYIGRSCIAAPNGKHLADASAVNEQVIYASVNIEDARQKRLVVTPGEFEMDFFKDRRPELYE